MFLSVIIATVLFLFLFASMYIYYSIKDSYSNIEIAVRECKHTRDIFNEDTNNKYFQRNREAFYLAKDNQNDFYGIYLKKGLFGWIVRSLFNLKGIDFTDQDLDQITVTGIKLGKSTVMLCRFSLEHFNSIQINGVEIEKHIINEFNKGFGFLLEVEKLPKTIEGFSKSGELIYKRDVTYDVMNFK